MRTKKDKRRVWCRASGARPLWTQPFRAGLIFGAGPLGLDRKHPFPIVHSPLNLPRASQNSTPF